MTKYSIPILLTTFGMAFTAGAAAQSNCAIQDPISGKCLATGGAVAGAVQNHPAARVTSSGRNVGDLPITGPYGQVSAPSGQPGSLGGVSERSAYYECAVYDNERQRCTVKASSAEERERALQAGIEAGLNGARVMHEVQVRAGLIQPSAAATMPSDLADGLPSARPSPVAIQGSAEMSCIPASVKRKAKTLGRSLTAGEIKNIVESCQK